MKTNPFNTRIHLTRECEQHPDPFDCPDVLVVYSPEFDEFGLLIRDGGSSVSCISYCPWCGKALPASKRERWFQELKVIEIEDPSSPDVPEEFKSDEWWRKRGH